VIIKRVDNDEVAFEIPNGFTLMKQQASSTGDDGVFKFNELPKGKYELTIEPENIESAEKVEYYANSNRPVNAVRNVPPKPEYVKKSYEFTIEDQNLEDIIIKVGFGATISGTVFVENSPEMPRKVDIMALNRKLGIKDTTAVYNDFNQNSGKPVKYNHDFRFPNFATGKAELFIDFLTDEYYVKSIKSGDLDLLTNPIELNDGENITNLQIILGKDVGTLKGKVFDEANEPAKDVSFTIVPTDLVKRKFIKFYKYTSSNEIGEFTQLLPPGEYAVMIISNENYRKADEIFYKWLNEAIKDFPKVTIEANKTATVSVKKAKN
jgi:hypothetical protein